MHDGSYPRERHDGATWQGHRDGIRAAFAGRKTKRRFRVMHTKGDWSEFCTTLGFPNWNSSTRPCLKRNAHPGNMFDFGAASPLSLPWVSTTQADYLAACQRCEVLVTLRNALQRDQILGVLAYDKRPTGARGRALTAAIPAMGLLVGDRLEPSAGLRDTGALELLVTFPADIALGGSGVSQWRSTGTLCFQGRFTWE